MSSWNKSLVSDHFQGQHERVLQEDLNLNRPRFVDLFIYNYLLLLIITIIIIIFIIINIYLFLYVKYCFRCSGAIVVDWINGHDRGFFRFA